MEGPFARGARVGSGGTAANRDGEDPQEAPFYFRSRSMYWSTKLFRAAVLPLLLVLCGPPAFSQITVEGLSDRTVYVDTVTFRVPAAAGFETTAALDGTPAPVGVQVAVDRPMYHELLVHRRDLATSGEESRVIQFIVRS